MRRLLDLAVERLVRLIVLVFFRELEVVGLERIPRSTPLVVVANHVNSLIDPLLLLGTLRVRPRFLAKSTLWRQPFLRPLFALGGVIPVYRQQDQELGVDTSRNLETFSRCHQLLAANGTVALFPEGLSHSEPSLQPLRTGAARIALEAEGRYGPLGVRIIPVGLVFDAKSAFRSRALVQVGEPIDPLAEADPASDGEVAAGSDDPNAVERVAARRLTERINRGLAAVTLNYESWQQARLIERAADLWATPSKDLPYDQPMADQFVVRQAFLSGLEHLREEDERTVAAVSAAVLRYDRMLGLTGLRDDQVASLYPRSMVAAFTWRSILRLLLALPLAIIGSLLNWLPYRLCDLIAARFAHIPDAQASYKVFPAIFLYPLTWTIEATAAALLAGPWAGVAVALLAPISGWVAALFHQRRERLAFEIRAYLLLHSHRDLIGELKSRRSELYERISELVTRYRQAEESGNGG